MDMGTGMGIYSGNGYNKVVKWEYIYSFMGM